VEEREEIKKMALLRHPRKFSPQEGNLNLLIWKIQAFSRPIRKGCERQYGSFSSFQAEACRSERTSIRGGEEENKRKTIVIYLHYQ
jgi:hypothetical protein